LNPGEHTRGVIHVVAAAVLDDAGRVLIAQRPTGKHLAGGWEFPGGKLDPGEPRRAGLARELLEEIGITIREPRPLIRVRHAYPDREVLLDIWVVRRYGGIPQSLDEQRLRWCTHDELATAELLPADRPIVAALRLPERLTQMASPYYEVGSRSTRVPDAAVGPMLHGVLCSNSSEATAATEAGADFVVMRAALADDDLAALCDSIPVPVFARGVTLKRAWALGASGTNEITAVPIITALGSR
jgi:mutator protein MutT